MTELAKAILHSGVSYDLAASYAQILSSAYVASPKDLTHSECSAKIDTISSVIARLLRKHFSDNLGGRPGIEDKRRCLRDVFALANKILAGEEIE